jgi:DNA polymerase-3 subunit delta'
VSADTEYHEPLVLPWQAPAWQVLERRIAEDRLHHGLLLCGPAGVGKRCLGARLALRLLCLAPVGGGACGACRSCQLMRAGTHPDCLRVAPEEPGKQIRIVQIRDSLVEFVNRTASVSSRKVVLIDPADAMNTPTANCLLKSLEEPAPRTHLLLLSDAPVRLLPTIRSRCEQLRLAAPPWELALRWLGERCDAERIEDLLGAASGCPLRALEYAAGGGMARFDRVGSVLRRAATPHAWVAKLARELEDMETLEVLRWMQFLLIDLARWMADPQRARIAGARELYADMALSIDARHVAWCLGAVVGAFREAGGTANPNRQLLLESLLLEWGKGSPRAAHVRPL